MSASSHDRRIPSRAVADRESGARLVRDGGAYTWIADPAESTRDGGPTQGPLAGFTFAVKDLIAVRGRPLGAGSAVRADAAPERADAAAVRTMRRAGVRLVGTTALHEFGFGVTGINDYTGTPGNPHDRERIPGGSSSGSAVAVAEGSARVALGTDTGGSVRIPAALCGVVGFKPAFGTYCLDGVFPLAPTMDQVGVLGRSVMDVAEIHALLGGVPAREAGTTLRIGILRSEVASSEARVADAVVAALGRLADAGVAVVDVAEMDPDVVFSTSSTILLAEAAAVHTTEMATRSDAFGADVRSRLEAGAGIPDVQLARARLSRKAVLACVSDLLDAVDMLAGPTVPMVAPRIAEARDPGTANRLVAHTRLANLTGLPAISIPIPCDGLPVGLQLLGADNDSVLAVGRRGEEILARG